MQDCLPTSKAELAAVRGMGDSEVVDERSRESTCTNLPFSKSVVSCDFVCFHTNQVEQFGDHILATIYAFLETNRLLHLFPNFPPSTIGER